MRRALEVEKMLRCVLNHLRPGSGDPQKLPIEVGSFGEHFSVRGEGKWSRHVEVNIQCKDDHYEKMKRKLTSCYM